MSGPFLLVLRIGMTLSLYAFIGWVFFFLWQNFKTESELLATRKTPPLTLIFKTSTDKSKTKLFRNPEITLGRDPHCDVCLDNETVSAHHARLSYHHGQWWLEDLNSTNGTKLNGEILETATIVIENDELRCGEVPIKVQLGLSDLSPHTREI